MTASRASLPSRRRRGSRCASCYRSTASWSLKCGGAREGAVRSSETLYFFSGPGGRSRVRDRTQFRTQRSGSGREFTYLDGRFAHYPQVTLPLTLSNTSELSVTVPNSQLPTASTVSQTNGAAYFTVPVMRNQGGGPSPSPRARAEVFLRLVWIVHTKTILIP